MSERPTELPGDAGGMPMHQPPNPADLRRAPPANAECARVRGLLRDFADGDLGAVEHRRVEEHVHACFACSVELSRAEHEVLRLRRGFARVALVEQQRAKPLPSDFPERVVDAILDGFVAGAAGRAAGGDAGRDRDASNGRREAGGDAARGQLTGRDPLVESARPAAGLRGDLAAVEAARADAARRRQGRRAVLLAFALLVACFAGLAMWTVGAEQQPERTARLIVQSARGAYNDLGRLFVGDDLGDRERLKVSRGGSARLDWHDRSSGSQPAATLAIQGEGRVRLEEGVPVLEVGAIQVETNRGVTIPVADGSRLELGVGEYLIVAHLPLENDDYMSPMLDPMASAPADLRIQIEVLRGEDARIFRSEVGATLVQAGEVGVYAGGSSVTVQNGGTQVASNSGSSRSGPQLTVASPQVPTMSATVYQFTGVPSVGTIVAASYPLQGASTYRWAVSDAYGKVTLTSDEPFEGNYAILQALPQQSTYGFVAPDARNLLRDGVHVRVDQAIVLERAEVLEGQVLDVNGQPRLGVCVQPCVVDELFGDVYMLGALRSSTDEQGRFVVAGLSPKLPHHQHLALLLAHPELTPEVVPVPVRSGANALLPLPPVVMKGLRTVEFHGLVPNSEVTVWEDVPSMPSRAIWRRTFPVDGLGRVEDARVGWGALWCVQGGGGSAVCRSVYINEAGPTTLASVGTPAPLGAWFRPMAVVPGTDLYVASSIRHEHLEVPAAGSGAGTTLVVRDGVGRVVGGAQVFVTRPTGPRGHGESRFLGMTSAQGVLKVAPEHVDARLVVLGPNGEVQFVPQPQQSYPLLEVELATPGRLLLGESLRPDPLGGDAIVPINLRLQLTDLPTGLECIADRFASQNTGWEVGGIVPGFYTVTIGNVVRSVTVPADGGFIEVE